MKAKKKNTHVSKKTNKKTLVTKPVLISDKTIVTTKEKTHTTIEDHF